MNDEIQESLAPKCGGVIHHLLDRALAANPRYVMTHWNIVNGRPVSKNCNGIPREGMPNCLKYQRSYSNIKRSRYPLLFDDMESVTDEYTLDRATIEQELQRFWISEGRNEEKFRLRSEVIFLCRLIVFRGDRGSFFSGWWQISDLLQKYRPEISAVLTCSCCTRVARWSCLCTARS